MDNKIMAVNDNQAAEVVYEKIIYEDGEILEAEHMNRIEKYIGDIYSILNAKPEIVCESVFYTSLNGEVRLQFSVKARGDIYVTIKKGLNVIRPTQKTSEKSFDILITDKATSIETNIYTIEVQDNFSNTASKQVTNIIVDANLHLTPEISKDLILEYEADMDGYLDIDNQIKFIVKGNQPILSRNPIEYKIGNNEYEVLTGIELVSENIDMNTATYEYTYKIPRINLGTFTETTKIQISFRAKMQMEENGDMVYTSPISIACYMVAKDTIDIEIFSNTTFTTNDKLYINYKVLIPNFANDELIEVTASIDENNIITHNILNNTNDMIQFGLFSQGNYVVEWRIIAGGQTYNLITNITIVAGADYVNEGLLAYFTASDYGSNDKQWKAKEGVLKEDIYFDIQGGHIWSDENTENGVTNCANLLLQPNGYAQLQNFNKLVQSLSFTKKENSDELEITPMNFSLELYYKAIDIGELKAPVITMTTNDNNTLNGLTLYHNRAYFKAEGHVTEACNASLLNNKWNHIVFTISQAQTSAPALVEDNEYYPVLKIYLNGCLIKCEKLDNEGLTWQECYSALTQLTLNGFYAEGKIAQSGQSQYELIRLYNKGLTSSQVLLNYKHAIQYTKNDNESLYNEVVVRNNDTSIAKIYFIRNKAAIKNVTKSDFEYLTFDTHNGFKGLNSIEKKKRESDTDEGPFSKTSAVNCTAFFIKNGVAKKYPNMDVYLQGTSSLIYPIKNYQIKNYASAKVKQPFLPPVIDQTTGNDWGGPEGDYVYTLKCDYMEHSHKNNTPTAIYYDNVLDSIITETNQYSPPRIVQEGETMSKSTIYRDSITGFPILVYYSDNLVDGTDLTEYEETASGLETTLEQACFNTGSYMFNIDKEGKALGFEYQGDYEGEATFDFALKDYYIKLKEYIINPENQQKEEIYSYLWNSNQLSYKFENVPEAVTLDELNNLNLHLYAYGYVYNEGATLITEQKCQLIDLGIVKFINIANNGIYTIEIAEDKLATYGTLIPLCLSQIASFTKPERNYCVSLEGTANSQDRAAATFYTVEEANDEIAEKNLTLPDDKKLNFYNTKFDFYTSTFEPRYSYSEYDEPNENTQYARDYEQLDQCIKFFKIVEQQEDNGFSNEDLINRFEQLFSKEYCLTYYLQMLVFTQVDNAGKNAMFDSWNGSKLYPRPYDMDTQMGFTNTGYDTVPVSAELFDSSAQGENSASLNTSWRYKGEGVGVDPNAQRLIAYNTRNSRLWRFVGEFYKEKIKQLYTSLRSNIYTPEAITTFMNSMTSQQISETQYNKDAVLKYLLPDKTTYFYVLAGNRNDRYYQYIQERFTFLDSVFEVLDFTKKIDLRADASGIVSWNFSSLSPQYVTVISAQGTKAMKFYVSPNLEYLVNADKQIYAEGMLMQYNNGSSNRETIIYGVNNLKFINQLASAIPSEINDLGNASNFSKLDIQNASSKLVRLDLSNNKRLNEVNIVNCLGLSSVSLANATNIKKVNLKYNNNLTSLTLPTSSPLTEIDLTNNINLQTLTLTNMPNLTTEGLILTGCQSLNTLVIQNCPQLVSINLNDLPGLTSVTIDNCETLTEFKCENHKKLSNLTISNCSNLETISLKNSVLTSLNLQINNNKLASIDLSDSILLKVLNLASNQTNVELNLKNCSALTAINEAENSGIYNFNGIAQVTALRCDYNTQLKEVRNLIYNGSGYYLFNNCTKLEKIQNSTLTLGQSLVHAFAYCNKLSDFTNTQLLHNKNNKITSMAMSFYACNLFPITIPTIIDTFLYFDNSRNEEVTSLSYAFTNMRASIKNNPTWTLNLNKLTSHITSMHYAFSGTNLGSISNKIVENSQLTLANAIFASNANLSAIPEGIFQNCSLLTEVKYAFSSDIGLTRLPNTMFNSNSLVICEGLFNNCTLLKDNLYNFMNNNGNNISQANRMFEKTAFETIPEGVFNKIHYSSAIGIFANCSNLTTLPSKLRNETSNLPITSLNLGGLFYNCSNLTGLIPATIFDNLKSYITNLGYGKAGSSGDNSSLLNLYLGAFANTNIIGYEIKSKENSTDTISPFYNMTALQSIDYLFASGTIDDKTTSQAGRKEWRIQNKESKSNFKGWGTNAEGQEPKGEISKNIFEGCTNITSAIGVFMGTGITSIEKSTTIPLLGNNDITDISLLFNNTNLIIDEDGGLTNFLNQLSIEKANYTFAKTKITNFNLLVNQTGLIELMGTYSGCQDFSSANREIPKNFFNNSKDTLTKVSYIFANSAVDSIEQENPEINTLSDTSILLKLSDNDIVTLLPSSDYTQLKNGNKIISEIKLNSSLNLILKYEGDYEDEELSVESVILKFNLQSSFKNTYSKYSFYGSALNAPSINYLFFELNELPQIGEGYYEYELCTRQNMAVNLIGIYKKIITNVNNSLFNNCTNLSTIEGAFMETTIKSVPGYIFESQNSLDKLTNISYLFANCYLCNEKDNIEESFIPTNWLGSVKNVNNINGLFAQLGRDVGVADTNGAELTKNQYDLGVAFDSLTKINQAQCAFAIIPNILGNTVLNIGFLNGSFNTLTNCYGIFSTTTLASIQEVFNSPQNTNKITDLRYGFSYCTNISNLIVPTYSSFPTSVKTNRTWETVNSNNNSYNAELVNKRWPTGSYINRDSDPNKVDTIRTDYIVTHITNNTVNKNCNYLISYTTI